MAPRCPRCGARRLETDPDRAGGLRCVTCRLRFPREEAVVGLGEAEALAQERARCTCDERRGCPQCFARAEAMVGKTVRDAFGREWKVVGTAEKDHFPTIYGVVHWDVPDQVEVLGDP